MTIVMKKKKKRILKKPLRILQILPHKPYKLMCYKLLKFNSDIYLLCVDKLTPFTVRHLSIVRSQGSNPHSYRVVGLFRGGGLPLDRIPK